jgi:predicted transcriptional regulator
MTIELPYLEFLVILSIISTVYVIVVLVLVWELRKAIKKIIVTGKKILEEDIISTLILWSYEKLKAGVPEEEIKNTILKSTVTRADEIIEKAKDLLSRTIETKSVFSK